MVTIFKSGPFDLSGQFDIPHSGGKRPGFLIVPGAAQHNRDGDANGFPGFNGFYREISSTVTNAGNIVFRYDKGGVGESDSGLSFPSDLVAAYRTLHQNNEVDSTGGGIIVHGAGSAHVYRRWSELNSINPIQNLIILGSGVNDMKLQALDSNLLVVVGRDKGLKSKNAVRKYRQRTNLIAEAIELENSDENLCSLKDSNPNVLKLGSCTRDPELFLVIKNWLQSSDI